ncbi:DUF1345 domain-containing protein [Sphingomonas sp. BT-65]|uniref:DUF1345 domain-containing protein n=1 Tax=Sphingomonas sp. BT-65 TaxID=2989821 RepID=UPI0022369538|nr:DUF1345 domain-containing protein [Sphingomonas sp. BT-65]MCW4461873.1 DUF1345 domain-containing protein [Sphingomonas sp. BT-65]
MRDGAHGTQHRRGIGNLVAPLRFLLFAAALAAGCVVAIPPLGDRFGVMAAFDAAALLFLASCLPLFRHESHHIRAAARANDANRVALLVITGAISLAVFATVASVLVPHGAPEPRSLTLVIATLAICWLFGNTVYALHYAHLFYTQRHGQDAGGLEFPQTPEPDYSDFVYFAWCLGMTFQTSDVTITSRPMRRAVTFHCVTAFVFNLGIIAFTINALGG